MTNFQEVPALQEKYGYKNKHEIPKLEKIVLNMGVGQATQDRKHIENAVADMAAISGQKPVICKARQSNASFKVREDMAIGCKVTSQAACGVFIIGIKPPAAARVRWYSGK